MPETIAAMPETCNWGPCGPGFLGFGFGGAGFCLRRWGGLLVFSLASAFCFWFASLAPVRGGTYFSLPPQRKVGKRKRLTPPARVLIHGSPTSPCFTRHCLSLVYVASASNRRLTHFRRQH